MNSVEKFVSRAKLINDSTLYTKSTKRILLKGLINLDMIHNGRNPNTGKQRTFPLTELTQQGLI